MSLTDRPSVEMSPHTDRPYRAALPEHEAMAEVAANSGSQFDPRAVDALVAVLGRERFE